MEDSRITFEDGRTLAYADFGRSDDFPVLFFHGAPMSRLHLAYLEDEFRSAGIRVVSPDRPAYGGSSPQPGRSMAEWPTDIATLADALGFDRFVVAGHSSGGPYTVACASFLPERVVGAIVLGGVTDMGWPGAWEGYMESEILLMRLADEDAAIAWCVDRYGVDGRGFSEAGDFQFGEPDEELFADEEVGSALASAAMEGFRQGVTGYAQDIYVQGRPWPFATENIEAPVCVLHGDEDAVVPLAHSRHTAERIAGSRLTILPGHGHLTTLSELPERASTLAASRR